VRCAKTLWLGLLLAVSGAAHGQSATPWRASSQAEQAQDAVTFQGLDPAITQQYGDVQSAVVVLRGRVVYEFYRDGAPAARRDTQSVAKSALSALAGIALGQGRIASLDQPVLSLMPEWAALNSDPHAAAITVRHLLTMTAGFDVNDASGTAPAGRPADAWARPLRSAPGQGFAYDNASIPLLTAVVEKAAGMPLADYARQELVTPLALDEPSYQGGLRMRTLDLAKLGHLFLQRGVWDGRQIVPESYVAAATQRQNAGGPPVSLAYGYLWWVVPGNSPRPTFLASGYGGQFIWVHPPLDLVVAVTSAVSPESQRRGQALQLILKRLFGAAQQRAAIATP
jgi:CubicO group peptidase (beta-lactamase class C family)